MNEPVKLTACKLYLNEVMINNVRRITCHELFSWVFAHKVRPLESDLLGRGVQPRPAGCMWPDGYECGPTQTRKFTLNIMRYIFFVITCLDVFKVWPKTTLLLPVLPRDAKMSDTPA